MSISTIPDELLREILSYHLKLSHDEFLSRSSTSKAYMRKYRHLASVTPPVATSDVLLVSKRWLRTGTPLLYECLALAAISETRAVATLFRAHEEVGRMVRCLRLEGGYGKELYDIARLIPNLENMLVFPMAKSCESIAGLRKAFPVMKPKYLKIDASLTRSNKNTTAIVTLLENHIKTGWLSLKKVIISDYSDFNTVPQAFISALREAPSLEEIFLPEIDAELWIERRYVQTVAENRMLKRITCHGGQFCSADIRKLPSYVILPERVKDMFHFIDDPALNSFMDVWRLQRAEGTSTDLDA